MKIAITTSGNSLDSALDQRFGRAASFLIYDQEQQSFTVIDNKQNLSAAQGAGIQAAETIAGQGVEVLLTGHCGPKAFRVLQAAGIKVYNTAAKTVQEALDLFRQNKLKEAETADVEGHWS
ncbi:MAG: dinitrogenase iron-molybdenum cofactor biosynthesis protein [Lentisphaerae bacterium]|nr:dinitrogenase iron-molybdenum cofactor biosynthesis protein [Lentisphaerota bacterium]